MRGRLLLFTVGLSEPGGAQRRSWLIAEGLAARGWRVVVIARAGSLRGFRLRRESRLTVLEVPGFEHPRLGGALYLAVAVPLGLIAGARAAAIVSVQMMSTSTAAGLCSWAWRRPFLALATTSGELSEVEYLAGTRSWWLRRRLFARASWLVAQTPEGAVELAALVPPERIVQLPNPVAVPHSPPELDGAPRVVFAGRLSAEKGLDLLLDAWSGLVEERPSAALVLAGAGGTHRSVEAEIRRRVAAESRLLESVDLPGWVDDMSALLASADVFVHPSRTEGMSNALLEACAAGRVVVASDIASNKAILGEDYPLLFSSGDANALKGQLDRALDREDPVRHAARARVLARVGAFSSESVIERLEHLIDAASSARN